MAEPDPLAQDPGGHEQGVEHLRLRASGVELQAVAAGPRDGPLVVLLHGFPEFSYGWRRQVGPLAAAGLRVLAPDQRGYNLSDKPEGVAAYTIGVLADDVLGLADAFGRERFAVVGHDWGAAVAWHLAARDPGRGERAGGRNGGRVRPAALGHDPVQPPRDVHGGGLPPLRRGLGAARRAHGDAGLVPRAAA